MRQSAVSSVADFSSRWQRNDSFRKANHSECLVFGSHSKCRVADARHQLVALEQRQRNRISLGAAARVVGMQVVPAVETREQLCRVTRVP